MWEEESDTEIGTPEEIKRKQYWKELKKDMNHQKILCCCKPNMIHDESLKYQLLYTEEEAQLSNFHFITPCIHDRSLTLSLCESTFVCIVCGCVHVHVRE